MFTDGEDCILGIFIGILITVFLGSLYIAAQDSQKQTEAIDQAKDNVFTQIDHNTTNADILLLINKECKESGYKDMCVSKLRDSFVINAKGT